MRRQSSPDSRILLIRLREIGDVVFTTPVIRALRDHLPAAHLSYLVEPPAADVVRNNPHLNDVIVAPPRRRGTMGLADEVRLIRMLRARNFDVVIDLHGGPRASILAWCSGAPCRVGYNVTGRGWMYTHRVGRARELRPRHSVLNQADLLTPLGIPGPTPESIPAEMALSADAVSRVSERLRAAGVGETDRVIAIHVSAGNPFRRWPEESFASLVARLATADLRHRIVLTSGPSDLPAARRVIAQARNGLASQDAARVLECGEFSLPELRALAERAEVFIGGDSGPMHIASTTNVPIVAIFGPTLPVRSSPWRPPGPPSVALETHGLACRPCNQRVCIPGDFRCLTGIHSDDVLAATLSVLRHGKMEPVAASVRPG